MNIDDIKGVGEKTLMLLKKLNLVTVEDILTYYPYRYNVYRISDINSSQDIITVKGIVESIPQVSYIKRNLNRLSFRFNTGGRIINVTIFNRAFLKDNIKVGRCINLVGKYNKDNNSFVASDIKFEI